MTEVTILTIRQPWAWAIFHAGKDIENRPWRTHYRGPLWIHAAGAIDGAGYAALSDLFGDALPDRRDLPTGALLGAVTVTGCTAVSGTPWFVGPHGWELSDPRRLAEPIPMRGQLSLFRRTFPEKLLTTIPSSVTIAGYGKKEIRRAVQGGIHVGRGLAHRQAQALP